MPKVLLTAFEPYDRWTTNASWLALMQLTRERPSSENVTTRLLPVDFATMKSRLAEELQRGYDIVLHMGQSPGSTRVQLEAIGINVAGHNGQSPDDFTDLSDQGPVAYRSQLPLGAWAAKIREAGIPAQVSYYAGTFLCNATLYWTHHLAEQLKLPLQAAFIHVPLDISQVVEESHPHASMPTEYCAAAVRIILEQLGV